MKTTECKFCHSNAPAVLNMTVTGTEDGSKFEFWFCGHPCLKNFMKGVGNQPDVEIPESSAGETATKSWLAWMETLRKPMN